MPPHTHTPYVQVYSTGAVSVSATEHDRSRLLRPFSNGLMVQLRSAVMLIGSPSTGCSWDDPLDTFLRVTEFREFSDDAGGGTMVRFSVESAHWADLFEHGIIRLEHRPAIARQSGDDASPIPAAIVPMAADRLHGDDGRAWLPIPPQAETMQRSRRSIEEEVNPMSSCRASCAPTPPSPTLTA